MASLDESEIKAWKKDYIKMLNKTAPNEFDVLHYAAAAVLKVKSN